MLRLKLSLLLIGTATLPYVDLAKPIKQSRRYSRTTQCFRDESREEYS